MASNQVALLGAKMCNLVQTQRRDETNETSFHSPALVPTLPPKWALLRRQSPPPSAFSPLATPSHLRTGSRQLPPRQRPKAGTSPAVPTRSPHPPQVGIQFGDGGACGKLVSSTSASPPPVPVRLSRRARLSAPAPPAPSFTVRAKCDWASGSRSPPPSARPTVLTAAASRDARRRAYVYECARDRQAGRRIPRRLCS